MAQIYTKEDFNKRFRFRWQRTFLEPTTLSHSSVCFSTLFQPYRPQEKLGTIRQRRKQPYTSKKPFGPLLEECTIVCQENTHIFLCAFLCGLGHPKGQLRRGATKSPTHYFTSRLQNQIKMLCKAFWGFFFFLGFVTPPYASLESWIKIDPAGNGCPFQKHTFQKWNKNL